jgi:CRP-like cAMP-binding protein
MEDSIFSKLQKDELLKILGISENVSFKPGDTVYKQGDPGDALYIIKNGEVSLIKINDIGEDVEFAKVGSGSFLGELSVLDDGVRELTAVALTDTEMFKLPKEKLELLKKSDIKVVVKFYLTVIKDINRRLRKINDEYVKIKNQISSNL